MRNLLFTELELATVPVTSALTRVSASSWPRHRPRATGDASPVLATPLPLALGRLRWAGTRKILSKYCYVGAWRPCWLAGATPQYAGLAGTWPPGLLAGWSAHKAAAAMRAGWAGDWAAEQGYCPVIVIRLRDAAHNSHSAPSQRSQLTGQGDVVIHVRPKKDKTFCLVFRLSQM